MSGLFAGAGLWATNNTAGNVPPAISGGISGGGFTWNYIGGSSELDYWNGWIGAVLSHTFWQHTGGAPIRLMDIGPTGSVRAYGGVNNTPIGNTTPAPGSFTTLSTSGNAYVGGGGGSWLVISQVGQGTDQNLWNIGSAAGGTLTMQAANDPFNNGTTWLTVTRTGFVPQAITLTAPSIVHAGVTVISAAGGPTIRAGPGAATGTQPKGSLWLRTDGAAGSTLYVTQGAGTWAAVAGV
jgi:hypothetical protein